MRTGSGARSQYWSSWVEQQGQVVLGQLGGRGGEAGVPVLGFGGSRVEGGEGHHGKLRGAEGRVEALVDRVAFPTALLPLRGHHGFYGEGQVLVGLRAAAGLGQGQHGVIGDEVRGLGFLVEGVGPAALRGFVFVELGDELVDLRLVFGAVDGRPAA